MKSLVKFTLLLSLGLFLQTLQASSWHHASSAHFEVLSETSKGDTQELLIKLEQLRVVFNDIFHTTPAEDIKTTVLYCRIGDTYRSVLDDFDKNILEWNWVRDGVNTGTDVYPLLIAARFRESRTSKEAITDYYIKTLLSSHYGNKAPKWFTVGFVECFKALTLNNDSYEFGKHSGEEVAHLQDMGLDPLANVFETPYTAWDNLVSKSSTGWAFVHFCLFGRPELLESRLFSFLQLIADRPLEPKAKLFTEAFGMTCKEMDEVLQRYIKGGKYKFRKGRLPARKSIAVTFDKYTEQETQAFTRIAITQRSLHSEKFSDDGKLAEALRPLLAGSNELLLLWGGRVSTVAGDSALTQACVKRLLELGCKKPIVYTTAVASELNSRVGENDWNIQLNEDLSEKLRGWVDQALELDPNNPEALTQLITIEALSKKIRPEKVNLVQKRIGSIPDRSRALCMLALIRFYEKDYDTVRQISESGLIDTPNDRAILDRILTEMRHQKAESKPSN